MKLLSIAWSHSKDGSSISLLNTLIGLREKGVQIKVALPREGFLSKKLKENDIDYIITPITYWCQPSLSSIKDYLKYIPRLLRTIINERRSFNQLKNLISEWNPDIIHTNVSVIEVGYRLSKSYNVPHVWHVREYGDLDFSLHSLSGKKKHRGHLSDSHVISITHALKKYHRLGEKAYVIYNGIEERKHDFKVNKKDKVIFVGRVTQKKGAEEILDAFISYSKRNPKLTLEFIGSCDPTYQEYLEKRIKTANLNNRIKFIGPVQDPYPLMQESKAIIVASQNEGFGRITSEAMLNECLVIGKNTAGTREQFDNGKSLTGREIGIRYDDMAGLEEGLLHLSDLSEEDYNRLIEDAKYTVHTLYSVKNNVNEIYDFLQSLSQTSI